MPSFMYLILLLETLLPTVLAAPTKQAHSKRELVPNKYIVTLRKDVNDFDSHVNWANGVHKRNIAERDLNGVEKEFHISDFQGYVGEFDEATIEEIKQNPDVASVEEDQVWYLPESITDQISRAQPQDIISRRGFVTQTEAIWGLHAISHRSPGSGSYIYDESAGEGTWAYVLDTGIEEDHVEFGGRASLGYNNASAWDGDLSGHGTHVAGTIAGSTYGVAKKATIIAVKVFSGSSSTTSVLLDGLNWTVNHIQSNGRENKSVINMSLSDVRTVAIDDAIESIFQAGIICVVAAGNDNADASTRSPAGAPNAITVGAINSNWTRWEDSNYGSVVDIFAPGVDILSTWIGGTSYVVYMSGTSMAAPHVSGVILYLQALEGLTAANAAARLRELATPDMVGDPVDSPNFILFNGNSATS